MSEVIKNTIQDFALKNANHPDLGVIQGVGDTNRQRLEYHFNAEMVLEKTRCNLWDTFYRSHKKLTAQVNQTKKIIQGNT